ncbi:uncharacterized protein [Macrobrachium rosenbergii]|uniref:uncharacterized protein n=1 Tax=Macrobrachium rosenbergii TaxID=79674 RepID=UPI0034D452F6
MQSAKGEQITSIKRLNEARSRIKKKGTNFMSPEKKRLMQVQGRLINEYIIREKLKEGGNRIKETAAEIKSKGGVNGAAFWGFQKKLDGTKPNNVVALKSTEGKIVEKLKEIKREYEQYCEGLFILDDPEDEIGRVTDTINLLHQRWMSICGRGKAEKIQWCSIHEVEKTVKALKNKYSPDRQGINNKIIKNMGTEMTESPAFLIEDIEEELNTQDEWEDVEILPLYKKGSKLELENKRGILITSNISKFCGRVMMEITKEKINQKISRFECVGLEGRPTVDHLLTPNAVFHYNAMLGAPTYIWFGDAYKCFERPEGLHQGDWEDDDKVEKCIVRTKAERKRQGSNTMSCGRNRNN